jgi:hypothetical protein
VLPPNYFFVMKAPHEQRLGPSRGPSRNVRIHKLGLFYDAAFAQTMTRGLVLAILSAPHNLMHNGTGPVGQVAATQPKAPLGQPLLPLNTLSAGFFLFCAL